MRGSKFLVRARGRMAASLFCGAIACCLFPQRLPAETSEYLKSLTRRSMASGFGQTSSIAVLTPEKGPGREAVEARLLARLNGKLGRRLVGQVLEEGQPGKSKQALVGEASYLEVSPDGTMFRFRGDVDNAKEAERTSALEKISSADLESIGRAFIAQALGDFVPLRKEETITFLGSRYLHVGGGYRNGKVKDQVIANIAIFGREVNGLPVVGSGSKIAVWFANDRELVAFDVDWPAYRPSGVTQRILPWDKLRARVDASSGMPSESTGAKISRFECGYVDLGVEKRGSVLQAGCSVAYEGNSGRPNAAGERLAWGRIEFVPAGENVLPDPHWPLAAFIAEHGEPSKHDLESIFAGENRDPGSSK